MNSPFKFALVLVAVAVITLTSVDLRHAAAAPISAIAQQDVAMELSAVRKKRRYRGNPFPHGVVGVIIIGSTAYYHYDDGPYIFRDPNGGLVVDDSNLFYVPPTSVVPGGHAPYVYRGFVLQCPVHRPFVGRATSGAAIRAAQFCPPARRRTGRRAAA